MYFTSTPSLNSMEAIMKRPPGGNQRGGGRLRRVYPVSKADCDCRLCLYHRKKKGCSMEFCPVLDVRLSCGAASLYEAVHTAFADARHIPFQRRLSHLYDRKDDAPMIFKPINTGSVLRRRNCTCESRIIAALLCCIF